MKYPTIMVRMLKRCPRFYIVFLMVCLFELLGVKLIYKTLLQSKKEVKLSSGSELNTTGFTRNFSELDQHLGNIKTFHKIIGKRMVNKHHSNQEFYKGPGIIKHFNNINGNWNRHQSVLGFHKSPGVIKKFGVISENWIVSSDNNQGEITAGTRNNKINPYNRVKFQHSRYMVTNTWLGQMGNQMFQYASLLGIASRHGYTAAIHPSAMLVKYFDIPNVIDWQPAKTPVFTETMCCAFDERVEHIESTANYSIFGYLQSWRYFQNISSAVRQALTIKGKYKTVAQRFVSKISLPGRVNVCVHVRRYSRYMDARKTGYTTSSMTYIHNAMNRLRRQTKHVQFIILSNRMLWCKANIKGRDVIYSPFGHSAILDMALMSLCDHVVLTSGTFGWWGAWLAGGISVYDRLFPRPDSWLDAQTNNNDYYPLNWVGL